MGDALALPWPDARFEAVVSGLVLNFVPDAARMAAEMVRVARPGGVVAAYVWDYGGGMQMMRRFWDVVLELRPQDAASDQAERFPICEPGVLEALWKSAGLRDVRAGPLEFDMVFDGFDDYWLPFLGRQGSAPTYLATLPESEQAAIRETLRLRLTAATDGTIHLRGRAWAVQGHRECSCEGR